MRNKLFIMMMLSILFVSLISADASIGTVKQGSSIQLTQTCSNCSYINLTSVIYPNNTYALLGQYEMSKNDTNYNYTWSDTNTNGEYIYTTCGDLNGVITCQSVNFGVTPSGNSEIGLGSAIIVFLSLLIILSLSGGCFYGFFKVESIGAKSFFFFGAVVFSFVAIIYNVLIVGQTLNNSSIISGFETFYTVITILMGLAVLSLIVFTFLILLKAWKIKRGLR